VLFFSNKPACLVAGCLEEKNKKAKLFLKGWEVWKANEHLFPHPNFLIFYGYHNTSKTKIFHVYFINKQALASCLTLHEAVLKEKLGDAFSKEAFLKDLEEKQIGAFKNHEALTGLLLGYGVESSFAFKNEVQQTIFCTKKEFLEFIPSTEAQLIKLKGIHVNPLTFMGNPDSPEVKSLQNRYTFEWEKIEALYQEKEILGCVLQALCSSPINPDFSHFL
jgi:hypothetical protein